MREIRISIFVIVSLLLAIGVIMIYSASAIYGYDRMGDSLYFLKRHLSCLFIGLFFMMASMLIDLEILKRFSKPILISSLLLLVLVLVPGIGRETGGARRWFRFWLINFQPSEVAKIAFIIYLSAFISRKGNFIRDFFYGYLPPLLILCCTAGLILLEPDLGTAILISAIALIMLFSSGVNMAHVLATFLVSIPFFYVLIFNFPYRRKRLMVFLNPWADSKGTGFQIIQSLVALGSGGLLGIGLGQSRQKLFYLPASYTDFIFSIIGEELGFLGAACVLILFMLFVWQGMRIVFKAQDSFKRLLSLGIITTIALEVIINIGVTSGVIPTKGLPLPFISYGGTSLITHMVFVGLLLNIAKGCEVDLKRGLL